MDEEKPFSIEFRILLTIIALANDAAEIFFDLLDFTGVGIAGEAIMEPANFILDIFFTGIFIWKVGPGGGTITQYIDDLLEPLLIPGRTISVVLGMWIANNPDSAIAKEANIAVSLENGGVGGVAGETEATAGAVAKETEAAGQKALQGETANAGAVSKDESATSGRRGQDSTPGSESPEGGTSQNTPEDNVFKNPLDTPVETAGEEAFNPKEDTIQEGSGLKTTKNSEGNGDEPRRGIHLVGNQPPRPNRTYNTKRGVADVRPPEDLQKAA